MNVRYPLTNVVDVHTTKAVAEDLMVKRIAGEDVGGFTITFGTGGWVDPSNGRLVVEESATIRLMHDDIGTLRRAVQAIALVAFVDHGEAEVWAVVVSRDAELMIVTA